MLKTTYIDKRSQAKGKTLLLILILVNCSIIFSGKTSYASDMIGNLWFYEISDGDTFTHISYLSDVGFVELRAANPKVDAWIPKVGLQLLIPDQHILPQIRNPGIVINLGDMRLYHITDKSIAARSWPIGIGHRAKETPLGRTKITALRENPIWRPNKSMRQNNPALPAAVPPGPRNPLGDYAIQLGWDEYAIHGTNKPAGVGRRISSGCIRLYANDMKEVFSLSYVGMPVEIINQPIKLGWHEGVLYLEAHPTGKQADQIETYGSFEGSEINLGDLRQRIQMKATKKPHSRINWSAVKSILQQKLGVPIPITF